MTVVHNGRSVTEAFARALVEQENVELTLALVDDGTSDGTADSVRTLYPKTVVLTGKGDLWWAAGLRKGLNWFSAPGFSDETKVVFMNDDVAFGPEFFSTAFRELDSLPQRQFLSVPGFLKEAGRYVDEDPLRALARPQNSGGVRPRTGPASVSSGMPIASSRSRNSASSNMKTPACLAALKKYFLTKKSILEFHGGNVCDMHLLGLFSYTLGSQYREFSTMVSDGFIEKQIGEQEGFELDKELRLKKVIVDANSKRPYLSKNGSLVPMAGQHFVGWTKALMPRYYTGTPPVGLTEQERGLIGKALVERRCYGRKEALKDIVRPLKRFLLAAFPRRGQPN